MNQNQSVPFATQDDFTTVALALLPPGDAWPRESDAVFSQMVHAAMATQARMHARAADLTEREVIPWTSEDLLPAWEAVYGLPDPCTPLNATIAQRQAALKARFAATGALNAEYYIQVAAAYGYNITISTFGPSKFNKSKFNQSKFYDRKWRFVLQVNAPSVVEYPAKFNASKFQDPYMAYSTTQLSCILRRIIPAWANLIMNYSKV